MNDRQQARPSKTFAAFVLVALCLFATSSAAASALNEIHRGWGRLSFTIGIVAIPISIGVALQLDSNIHALLIFAAGCAAFASCIWATLYGWRLALWINAGFAEGTGGEQSESHGAQPQRAEAHPKEAIRVVPNMARDENITLPLAGPWRRYFARFLDLWVLSTVVDTAIAICIGALHSDFFTWLKQPGATLIFGLLCVPAVLTVEAIIHTSFGNSPFKALFGIRVCKFNGEHLSFKELLHRQIGVYWYGIGTGFPIASLGTMTYQYFRLRKGLQVTYDEDCLLIRAPIEPYQSRRNEATRIAA